MRPAMYFNGNGTAQALIILLTYLVVFAVILRILQYYRLPEGNVPISRQTEAEAAAVAVPAGVT
jgi:uncharacterized membrane protein